MKKAVIAFLPIISALVFFIGTNAKTPNHGPNSASKVFSTNACIDQALVYIAPDKIGSLSHYSKDKTSNPFFKQTEEFPKNNGDPEEILFEKPDLILTGGFEKPSFQNSAKIIGASIHNFGMPASIAESKNQIFQIGKITGGSKRADSLIAAIEELEAKNFSEKIPALVLYEGGHSAGENTLIDDALDKSGFINHARQFNIGNWGKIDIEQLLSNPPQIVIVAGAQNTPSIESRILNHDALKNKKFKIAHLPKQYTYCGGPIIPVLLGELQSIRGEYEK